MSSRCRDLLVERHGGEVPRTREALTALARASAARRRMSCSTSPSIEPVIAVDTHIFRVSNRLPLATGTTPEAVEAGLGARRAGEISAARASLAHSARPLCLQGAQARMPALHHRRFVSVQGKTISDLPIVAPRGDEDSTTRGTSLRRVERCRRERSNKRPAPGQ